MLQRYDVKMPHVLVLKVSEALNFTGPVRALDTGGGGGEDFSVGMYQRLGMTHRIE